MPADPRFVFQDFYDRLKDRGYVIYPGKLTVADSFRIGCIGRLYPEHMRGALAAIRDILAEMGVKLAQAGQGSGVRSVDEHPAHRRHVSVNGRDYRFPKTPTVVVCIDGSEPGYIERAIERASRRTSRG